MIIIVLNKIFNMDCLEGMKEIQDNSVDLILTDCPYKTIAGGSTTLSGGIFSSQESKKGVHFIHNTIEFHEWVYECYRVLKEKTHIYIMVNDRNLHKLINECEKAKFKLVNILVWQKNKCTPNRYYMKNCEFIVMLRKGEAKTINNPDSRQLIKTNNIIGNKLHPTQKPVNLFEFLITNSTNEGELVLDMFMGSGTTAVACINTNRKYIGFEINEEYWITASQRIEDAILERNQIRIEDII